MYHSGNISFFLSLMIVSMMCSGCNYKNGEKMDDQIIHIIQDRSFTKGLFILGNSSSQPAPIATAYPFEKDGPAPAWSIAQWGSPHLLDNMATTIEKDTVIYQNEAKRIYFQRDGNKENTLIGLEVYASKEYVEPRGEGEDWVHLLFGQDFPEPFFLNNIEKLTYRIKSKLLFCENKMGEDYNPELHTAQITLFLTIQNRNQQSSSHGDFFWFGLPLYDYRYRDIPGYAAQDLGKDDASQKFIFTVAGKDLLDAPMHDLEWITIDNDIYPLIQKAFETCQENGYMTHTKFEDLYITSVNIGWEVPGTFDCGILFECPSLTATKRYPLTTQKINFIQRQ